MQDGILQGSHEQMMEEYAKRYKKICIENNSIDGKLFDERVHRQEEAANQLRLFLRISLKRVAGPVILPVEYPPPVSVEDVAV